MTSRLCWMPLGRATPVVIDAEPRLSPHEWGTLRDSIQIEETGQARSVETDDWLYDVRGYVEHGLAEVHSPFRSADVRPELLETYADGTGRRLIE